MIEEYGQGRNAFQFGDDAEIKMENHQIVRKLDVALNMSVFTRATFFFRYLDFGARVYG